MREEKQELVCVVGPTATGKTAVGVTLAGQYGGEVVSADSMQLYRGIHIASAAPDAAEMQGIPHYMLEFLDPGETFTVADYAREANRLIGEIAARGHLPLLVGGTGLYISTVADGLCFAPEPADPALRQRLSRELSAVGAAEMLRRLSAFDPESAARLHPNNTRRILRAFEVYEATGLTVTEQNARSRPAEPPYDLVMIGLTCRDRQKLYDRIDRRVDAMLEKGLLDEARASLAAGGNGGAGQAIGHKELYPYLRGEVSLDEAVRSLKNATHHYAKRQLTWFRRDPRIHWIETDTVPDAAAAAVQFLSERRNGA